MPYRTHYNKRDENEAQILEAIHALGVETWEAGPLDFWAWLGDQFVPIEVKAKKGKLTPGQKEFISRCNMLERPYRIWRTPLEAIECVQEFRRT